MRNLAVGLAVSSLLILSFTAEANASPITLTAMLSGGTESPPNSSPALGSVTVVYDGAAHTLGLQATFSGLTGLDTAAHIHCCTTASFTGTAGVATTVPAFVGFPLGVTSGFFDNLLHPYDLTDPAFWNPTFLANNGGSPSTAEAAFAEGLPKGTEYFNIHTDTIPSGEIRGFLQVQVPEPATLAMFGAGLLGVGAIRRRVRNRKDA